MQEENAVVTVPVPPKKDRFIFPPSHRMYHDVRSSTLQNCTVIVYYVASFGVLTNPQLLCYCNLSM